MAFGPIGGMNSLTLLNSQRAEREAGAPRFEVDATARTGDESYSSSQEDAQSHSDRKSEEASAESAGEESREDVLEEVVQDEIPQESANVSDSGNDWFV